MRNILLATMLICAAIPALADEHDPIPGKYDSRIRSFSYNPGMTLRITTPGVTPVKVMFTPNTLQFLIAGELVSTDQGSDKTKAPADWFVKESGPALVIQPLRKDIPPSILFVTGKLPDNQQYDYVLELVVGTGDLSKPDPPGSPKDSKDPPGPYYQVAYTYPQELAAKVMAERQLAVKAVSESKVKTSFTQARFAAPRTWNYSKKGQDCDKLTPPGTNWISNDSEGHQTSMLFPTNIPGSAIFHREDDNDKNEVLITPIVTQTRVGTLYVLPGIYKQIVLRRGITSRDSQVCALRPNNLDNGLPPGTGNGTISNDVIRVPRSGK